MYKIFISAVFAICLCVSAQAQDIPVKPAETTNAQGESKGLKLISKPGARYTEMAKRNNQEGSVTLKITFLASGEIGEIFVTAGLPYGLTEQAIAAARQIEFEPATKNGQAYTLVKTVVYSFVVPYSETEMSIKKRAVILEQPKPEYPAGENFKNMRGRVRVEVTLTSFGEVNAVIVSSDLPKEFGSKAISAARKIKYEPAEIDNKTKVSVIREIEYEFKPEN